MNWENHVKFDPRMLRPAEVDLLIGTMQKRKRKLGMGAVTKMKALAELDG